MRDEIAKIAKLFIFNILMLLILLVYFFENVFPNFIQGGFLKVFYNLTHGENFYHLEFPLVFLLAYLFNYNKLVSGTNFKILDWLIVLGIGVLFCIGVVHEIYTGNQNKSLQTIIFTMMGFFFILLVFGHSLLALVKKTSTFLSTGQRNSDRHDKR